MSIPHSDARDGWGTVHQLLSNVAVFEGDDLGIWAVRVGVDGLVFSDSL
jgi:hypothetical protein